VRCITCSRTVKTVEQEKNRKQPEIREVSPVDDALHHLGSCNICPKASLGYKQQVSYYK